MERNDKRKKISGILFVILFIFIDQVTKLLAKHMLEDGKVVTIIPGVFQLRYLENKGAAFGMLQNKTWFFVLITIIVLAGIIYCYMRMPETKHYRPVKYILLLISAGAAGNFIDRIIYGYVIDFFYIEWIDFPIFNVADCYVSISAVFLVVLFLFYYKDSDFDFLSLHHKKHEKRNS